MTFAAPYSDLRLDETQLRAYFALMDVAGLLRHKVEQQLRGAAALTYVQFKVLARLGLDSPTGSLRMTELADEVVYSRSGLTYQAGQMENGGLGRAQPVARRRPRRHPDDHRRRPRPARQGAARTRRRPARAPVRDPDRRGRQRPRRAARAGARPHARRPAAIGHTSAAWNGCIEALINVRSAVICALVLRPRRSSGWHAATALPPPRAHGPGGRGRHTRRTTRRRSHSR